MYIVYDARYPDESASVALAAEDRNEALRCAVEIGIGTKIVKFEDGNETLDFEVGVDEFPVFSSEGLYFAYRPLPGKIHYSVYEAIKKFEDPADRPSRSFSDREEAIKIADQLGVGASVCEFADWVAQGIYFCIYNEDFSEKYEDEIWEESKTDHRWLTFRDE